MLVDLNSWNSLPAAEGAASQSALDGLLVEDENTSILIAMEIAIMTTCLCDEWGTKPGGGHDCPVSQNWTAVA